MKGADQLWADDGNDTLYAKGDGTTDPLVGGAGTDKAQRDDDLVKKIVDAVSTIESYF